MPPLPLTTQTLTSRLNSLSESNKSINHLVQRLAKLDFQPGSQPLNAEEGDIRLELSAEIHESLKQVEEELELLRQEVEDVVQTSASANRRRDSTKVGERSRLAVLLTRLTEDLRLTRSQYRKAQLTAKHNAERAKLKERELLFSSLQSGSSTPASLHRRKSHNTGLSEGEVVQQASSDVTAALRRTYELMQNELSRSRFAQETLETSTAALTELGEKYSDLNTLLANSKNLVSTLLKSQKSDTWYLETTFYILITTVIWLIFRRWLYGPISWFILWPLKILFRIVFGVVGLSTASNANTSVAPAEPSTSLIVKPSAKGGIPRREINPNQPQNQPYIRVGGGGRGYAQEPSPPGSLSQKVGQMAEQNQQQQQQQQQQAREPVRRADGTILQESDKPRNPKKRMWEENVERERYEQEQEQQHKEGGQTQQQEAGQGQKDKDEL